MNKYDFGQVSIHILTSQSLTIWCRALTPYRGFDNDDCKDESDRERDERRNTNVMYIRPCYSTEARIVSDAKDPTE